MKYRHTAAQPLENPEMVINLWAYSGEDGTILRLGGKTYVMQGTDAEKLALLRRVNVSATGGRYRRGRKRQQTHHHTRLNARAAI